MASGSTTARAVSLLARARVSVLVVPKPHAPTRYQARMLSALRRAWAGTSSPCEQQDTSPRQLAPPVTEQPPSSACQHASSAAGDGYADDWVVALHYDELDSTQSFVEREHENFDQGKLTVVSADLQTAGRGTGGRTWAASPGESVLATFFFRFPAECPTAFVNRSAPNVTQVLAVSAASALGWATANVEEDGEGQVPEASIGLKWPNDIILNGGKVGGILARAVPFRGRLEGIIIGIGLNINTSRQDLAGIERPVWPATSLRAALGRRFDVSAVRGRLVSTFASNLRTFFSEGFLGFRDQVNQLDVLCGKPVSFRTSDTNVENCIYEGIDKDGLILLRLSGGETEAFPSGEIVPWQPGPLGSAAAGDVE